MRCAAAVDAYLAKVRDQIKKAVDGAKGKLDTAKQKAMNGASETVAKAVEAAAEALKDAAEGYWRQIKDDLSNAVLDLAARYPAELHAVITGLEKIDAAVRNGNARTIRLALQQFEHKLAAFEEKLAELDAKLPLN